MIRSAVESDSLSAVSERRSLGDATATGDLTHTPESTATANASSYFDGSQLSALVLLPQCLTPSLAIP